MVENSTARLKFQRRGSGSVPLTAIISVLQSEPSFGIYHAFSRLSAKLTGGKHGHRKEIEEERKASPQGF
jgi:hypothetical protein